MPGWPPRHSGRTTGLQISEREAGRSREIFLRFNLDDLRRPSKCARLSGIRGGHPRPASELAGYLVPWPTRTSHNTSHITGSHARRWPDARCVHARWLAAQGGVAWLGSLHGGGAVSAVPHMAAFLPGGIVRRTQRVCVRRGGCVRAYHSSKRTSAHTKRLPARPPQHVGPAGSEDAQLSKHLTCAVRAHARGARPPHSKALARTRKELKEWCFMCTTSTCRKCGGAPRGCSTTATSSASRMSSYSTLIQDATRHKQQSSTCCSR